MLIVLGALIFLAILFPGFMRLVFQLLCLIVLFAILQTCTAKADDADLPMYDPTAVCQNLLQTSGQVGDLSRGVKQCIANEQEAYYAAKEEWPAASDKTKALCTNMVRKHAVNPPYELLETCLYSYGEQDALSKQGAFHY